MNRLNLGAAAALLLALGPSSYVLGEGNDTVRPPRVSNPPVIDGALDDEAWARAEPITDFVQWDPDPGEPVSEKTELRIVYDRQHLYFAFRGYDRSPERIVANIFERDADLWNDDSVAICIDSNDDNRTSFEFRANLNCAVSDAQLVEGGTRNWNYDAVWTCAARRDDQGFSIEIAIPFYALRFRPADEVKMGLLVERDIPRRKEYSLWPALSRDYTIHNVSRYGTMAGLGDIDRGVDLEIKPAVIAGRTETRATAENHRDLSLDVKWGLTPGLTADFTANTDFAQVESDALEVNLTRFSLFFPEKREFFLESPSLFQFGPEQAQAFFSRRIGLSDGKEVPILGGARLYGLFGQTNIGLLTMHTGAADGVNGEQFTVGRVKHNLLDRSYVGGIFTSRIGHGAERDRTLGVDASYVFGINTTLYASAARSDRPGVESGEGFYYGFVSYQTDRLSGRVAYTDIGENYNPGLGFVPRPDQRSVSVSGAYKPRPSWEAVRQMEFHVGYDRIANHAGIVETETARFEAMARLESGDNVWVVSETAEEFIPARFEIAPGFIVPSKLYAFKQVEIGATLNESRLLMGNLSYRRGGFLDGEISKFTASLTWKPIPRLHLTVENLLNDVELPGGGFDANVHRFYASFFFSPNLSTRAAAQYSTLNRDLVLNFRVRWLYAPGSEAWLVYDEGRRFGTAGPSAGSRALILKVVHDFSF